MSGVLPHCKWDGSSSCVWWVLFTFLSFSSCLPSHMGVTFLASGVIYLVSGCGFCIGIASLKKIFFHLKCTGHKSPEILCVQRYLCFVHAHKEQVSWLRFSDHVYYKILNIVPCPYCSSILYIAVCFP